MSTVTLDAANPIDVLAATSRAGVASLIQNQSHTDMRIWLNVGSAPDESTKGDFVLRPWDIFDVDGTKKVWCFTRAETVVSVSDQQAIRVRSSIPSVTSAVIMSLQTSTTGTSYVAFASQACTSLDIVNNSGTTIEYRRGAAGTAMQIPSGAARMIIGITNANQIDIRRTDTSNTQVAIQAEAFGA